MGAEKEPKTPSEFLDRLGDFLQERPEESNEKLRARLRDEGVDPDQVVARVRQLVDSKMKEARLAWRERARQARLGIAERLADVHLVGQWSREQLLGHLRDLLAGSQAPAYAHFRNFERMTDDDLRSLLEDFERMAELEKHEQAGSEGQGDAGIKRD